MRSVALTPFKQQRQFHVLIGVEHGHQRKELEDEADLFPAQVGASVGVEAGHILAVDQDRAAVRLVETAHELQRGRLARAGRPDQRREFARLDVEADAVHRVGDDLADFVGFCDVV